MYTEYFTQHLSYSKQTIAIIVVLKRCIYHLQWNASYSYLYRYGHVLLNDGVTFCEMCCFVSLMLIVGEAYYIPRLYGTAYSS